MIFQADDRPDPTMRCGRQVASRRRHAGAEPGEALAVLAMLGEVGFDDPDASRTATPTSRAASGSAWSPRCGLINGPELVVCDELTTALDVTAGRCPQLIDRVLAAQNAACLFISHDLAVVSQLCTDVLVMLDGELVERGTAQRLLDALEHPYTSGCGDRAADLVEPGTRPPTVEDFYRRGAGEQRGHLRRARAGRASTGTGCGGARARRASTSGCPAATARASGKPARSRRCAAAGRLRHADRGHRHLRGRPSPDAPSAS